MPKPWAASAVTQTTLGTFHIEIQPPGGKLVDVTYFRNVPTQLQSYSFSDPFGASTAVIQFPQITILDAVGVGAGELSWLQDFANVTVYVNTGPVTAHTDFLTASGYRQVLWEGFLASWEWSSDDNSSALTIQCQGAMFQMDKYVQRPFYPWRPWAYESLISASFDHKARPALRTQPLKIEWPAGWTKTQPTIAASTPSYLQPWGVTPGQKITGYFGRDTGSWDKSLTGFIQSLLAVMYDDRGQQWTMRLDRNRQPVLYVRERFGVTPKYSVHAGQPGVTMSLTRDLTQFANIIYGEGTDINGVEWDRQVIDSYGYTRYEPMAYDPEVYPEVNNPKYNPNKMTVEANIKYTNGFDERQAMISAAKTLKVDMDPGLAGTMTLKVSPQGGPKEYIRAGETIIVYFLLGSGSRGVVFNIAQADHNPIDGTVELKIDSKFRDLLTLEEVLVRTRDPLTPVTMLQINKRSVIIQDQLAPWNYSKGSGYMPIGALPFYKDVTATERFPYAAHAKKYPPKKYPHYYIACHANSATRPSRWTTFPIRMAEKGTIRISQFAAYDKDGNILKIPFHLSIYNVYVTQADMPYDAHGPSPFIPNAFESVDANGLPIPADTPGVTTMPQQQMVIGWGHATQPAGYSPGQKTAGDPVTGLLADDTPWTFDLTNRFPLDRPSNAEVESVITMYGIVYAEYHDYVYFTGRLYRQEPGF